MSEKKPSPHELVRFFIHTDRLHRSLVEMRMSDLNLHRSQHIMLACISSFSEPPTQRQIAEKLDISAATVAVTIKKLEAAGYLEKTQSDGDSRCNRIVLSEKGKEILIKAKDILSEIDSLMFVGISDKELTEFSECLEKIQKNLKSSGATLLPHMC